MAELTARQRAFVREYLIDSCGAKAAIRAGYSEKQASTQAAHLLKIPHVKAAIRAGFREADKRSAVKNEEILDELARIAFADSRELTELHRVNCRHCWSPGHEYQHTDAEVARYERSYAEMVKIPRSDGLPHPPMEKRLGGFDPKREPNEACTDCAGRGVIVDIANDTRHLSPDARALFAGVKRTKDGIEIKSNDKLKALELLARCKGMLDKPEPVNPGEVAGTVVVRFVRAVAPTE